MSRWTYQGTYGERARSNWGSGKKLAEYALGDVVWISADALAVTSGRVDRPGLHRVHSCFSIAEDASYYYRTSPMEATGRGDRLRTLWDVCSDRLHVFPSTGTDYTAGWVRIHSAKAPA